MTERKYAYFFSLRVFQHAAARDVAPLPMSCEIIPKTGQLGRVADVAASRKVVLAAQTHGYGSAERWLSLPRTDNHPYERPMVIPRADSRLWVRRPTVIPSTDPWLWGTRRSIRLGFHYTPLVTGSIPASRQRLVLAGINRASGGSEPSSTPKRGGENRCRNKTQVIINFTYPYCIVKISMVQCAYLCI